MKHDPPALDLSIAARVGASFAAFLRPRVLAAHEIARSPVRELSIALVGDAEMSRLHRDFLGIAGPTDVLTFELDHNPRGRVTGGEIVICVPEARRRAKKIDGSVKNELLLYAVHGLLHLSGHDDRTAAGFATMHRTEDRILSRLGVGPVFSRPQLVKGAKG